MQWFMPLCQPKAYKPASQAWLPKTLGLKDFQPLILLQSCNSVRGGPPVCLVLGLSHGPRQSELISPRETDPRWTNTPRRQYKSETYCYCLGWGRPFQQVCPYHKTASLQFHLPRKVLRKLGLRAKRNIYFWRIFPAQPERSSMNQSYLVTDEIPPIATF